MNITSLVTDWFNFKKMCAPLIIKIVYILSNLILLLYAILMTVWAFNLLFSQKDSFVGLIMFVAIIITTVLFLILGVLIVRLLCESIIVIFNIHESLVAIEKKLPTDKKRE